MNRFKNTNQRMTVLTIIEELYAYPDPQGGTDEPSDGL